MSNVNPRKHIGRVGRKGAVLAFVLIGLMLMPTAAAEFQTVGTGSAKGSTVKVGLGVYKDTGELDAAKDYYAIKVTVSDIKYQRDAFTGPLYAHVRLTIWTKSSTGIVGRADEDVANHQPQNGFYPSASAASFGFAGAGIGMQIPGGTVTYTPWYSGNLFIIDWVVSGTLGDLATWFLFDDFAEFMVQVGVPQGYGVTVQTYAFVQFYKTLVGLVFVFVSEETTPVAVVIYPLPPSGGRGGGKH